MHSICTPWIKKEIPSGILNHTRHSYTVCIDNIKILVYFIVRQLNLRDIDVSVNLPVFGHLCMHVHKGYKVFDLRREMVIKVFDSDVCKDSITDEIERLKLVSGIPFAPSIGNWDIDRRWYEEEYVSEFPSSSYKTMESGALLSAFRDIIPCFNGLMIFREPLLKDAADYADNIFKLLDKGRASEDLFDTGEVNKIMDFMETIRKLIIGHRNSDIYLVFSHGDFCAANILKTAHGIKVLDWEGTKSRSALFDFYSYFFYLPVCINHSLVETASSVNDALQEYVSGSTQKNPDICKSISANSRLYRYLFYLEFIHKLVEREATDRNLNITDFIFRYIDAFIGVEEIISDKYRNETIENNDTRASIGEMI